jgi:hypothetical protein
LKTQRPAQDSGMQEPGLDRHEWESELASLEDEVREDPLGALTQLDGLVARMLEETGIDENDDARREFAAAHEITEAAERGSDELSPGDVAAAINGYRTVFDYIVTLGKP